jgi:ABC-type oligopeptide transport system substrate-binding subunit
MASSRLCFACWSNMTRLLNTGINARAASGFTPSSTDMFGGLSHKCTRRPSQSQRRWHSRLPGEPLQLSRSRAASEDGTELTFRLRHGVKWHDGRLFGAADVKCTWDLILDTGPDKLRANIRKSWYKNLKQVTTNGDDEVTFRLKRPQPAFMMLIADGRSPIYPCHVPQAQMRQHPIGTGPFKFVEFKPNESIKLTRNPDYWKPGLPYLDGIEFPMCLTARIMCFSLSCARRLACERAALIRCR